MSGEWKGPPEALGASCRALNTSNKYVKNGIPFKHEQHYNMGSHPNFQGSCITRAGTSKNRLYRRCPERVARAELGPLGLCSRWGKNLPYFNRSFRLKGSPASHPEPTLGDKARKRR